MCVTVEPRKNFCDVTLFEKHLIDCTSQWSLIGHTGVWTWNNGKVGGKNQTSFPRIISTPPTPVAQNMGKFFSA